jgi:diguanylate cyclase (GGDEF)-like protein
MNREMDRSQELEAEVAETRGALARARDDLLGVRAGERRERHRATHDGLTLLPNRTFFLSSLRKAVAAAPHSGRGPGIFYLDLDDFKSINDTHGHALGDQLLRVVAARLLQAVRMEDVVCRLGGDEFACLLGGPVTKVQLGQLACKLFDSVAGACKIGEVELLVHVSIGIAHWPDDGVEPEILLKNADRAMYQAKRVKSGYAFCDSLPHSPELVQAKVAIAPV